MTDDGLDEMMAAIAEVRATFVASIPKRRASLEAARAAWQNGDDDGRTSLKALVHALRGTSGTLGLMGVSTAASALEDAVAKHDGIDASVDALFDGVLRALEAASASPPPAKAAETSGTGERLGARVLAVDDAPEILATIRAALEASGVEVRGLTDGRDIVAAATTFAPDLVILDIEMPGLRGFDVLDVLRREPALEDVPVVFMTAHDDVAERIRAFDLGAVDFMAKPVDASELRARVLSRLRKRPAAASPRGTSEARDAPRESESATPAPPRSPAAPSSAVTAPRRALVADDEPLVRALVSRLLERDGWLVEHAPDGAFAADMLVDAARSQAPFQLVVLDLHMPRRSGFEVLDVIGCASPETKAVVLSAQSRDADVVRVLGRGASDFVSKPFSAPKLMARVARLFPSREPDR